MFIFFILCVWLCLCPSCFVPFCVLLFLGSAYFFSSVISLSLYSIVLLKPYFPTSGCTLIGLRKSTQKVTSYSRPRFPYPLCYLKNYHQAAMLITLHLFFLLAALLFYFCWLVMLRHPFPTLTLNQAKCCAVFFFFWVTSAVPLLRSQFNNLCFFLFLPCSSLFPSPLHVREKVMQYTEVKNDSYFL